jgi:SAGA-associated factor 29
LSLFHHQLSYATNVLTFLPPARGESPSLAVDTELEERLRANIKLTEELQNLIESDNGNDLLKSLEILTALRDAHEPDPISRAGSAGKSQRDRNTKRKHTETLEDRESIESPGVSSPKVMIPNSASRLMKGAASRANSVPVAREGSVKADDGGESADSLKRKARLRKL